MLTELRIKDFVLIDDLSIEFGRGLNVLTGETGAGKSIIIDALGLVLGDRSGAPVVRKGASQARVEASFETGNVRGIRELLEERGLSADDETLTCARVITADGKTRAYVNGSPTTVAVLKELGERLIDVHGQHEHQSLLRKSSYVDLLDDYASLTDLRGKVEAAWRKRQQASAELEALRSNERERRRREDHLRYQIEEIDGAELSPGEEEELAREREVMRNSEKLATAAALAYAILYESPDDEPAVIDRLGEVSHQIATIAAIDERMRPVAEALETAQTSLGEAAREIGSYAQSIEHSPQRQEEVEARLDLLSRLKSKYGASVQDILAYVEEARQELNGIEASDERIRTLEEAVHALEKDLIRLAEDLSKKRTAAGTKLGKSIEAELEFLGMKGARFRVTVSQNESGEGLEVTSGKRLAVSSRGFDDVEFEVAANPGQDPRPLREVASGGEISRIMLAIKTVFVKVDPVPVMVFDEIDLGVGGKVADAVGRRLSDISRERQVLCITHLASIASRSDVSLGVHKVTKGSETRTMVKRLEGEERATELARMLGDDQSEHSLEYAREMLGKGKSEGRRAK